MRNNNASLDEFTLLYIGQSKNLIERLESHKTIQKICRECDLEYNDFEILIMALHPKAKDLTGSSYKNYCCKNYLAILV